MLVEVLEALRIVAVMLSPVTPSLAEAIYLQLGYSKEDFQRLKLEDSQWGGKPPRSLPEECLLQHCHGRQSNCQRGL